MQVRGSPHNSHTSVPMCLLEQTARALMLVLPYRWQLDTSSQQAQLLEQSLTQQLTAGWSDKDSCKRFVSQLMKSCKEGKAHLSSDVVAGTAAYLAQKQWWGALDALLRGQAPASLAQCPGLILAMVEAGQFSMLPGMFYKVCA